LGVSLERILSLFNSGVIGVDNPKVLDIGCSNVHSIDAAAVQAFVRSRNDVYEPESLERWSRFLAAGGVMDPEIGGINGAWLGDLLERAGIEYRALDIFEGYKTKSFDLNHQDLDAEDRGWYDVVLNFGTTEHLLGQFNAFKVIHEATAVGGIIYHDLPMTGHLDHGFYNYNPVLLLSLAEANGYEVIRMWFDGGLAGESLRSEFVRRYGERPYFAVQPSTELWMGTELPTASLSFIARKLNDAPFRASLETSTTVGAVVGAIDDKYGVVDGGRDARAEAIAHVQGLLVRCRDPDLSLAEMNAGYQAFVGAGLTQGFPLTLELAILEATIVDMPDEVSLRTRRDQVLQLLRKERPLLKAVDAGAEVDPGVLAFDGVEAGFDESGEAAAVYRRIVAAYRAYAEKAAVETFPPRLEATALEHYAREVGRDPDVLIRIGQVMALVTPSLTLARREDALSDT
jgi:hypothetical protein